jgi:hypothetical protein
MANRKWKVARPARFERTTACLEGRCSIQLSYGRNRINTAGSSSAKVKSIFGKPRRHIPSGIHYARWHAKGKFIRKSLKKPALSVGKLRLAYAIDWLR